jgi:hypothetical protein
MSSHSQPVPSYPASHVHVYDPSLSWHVASSWHGLLAGAHSSTSFWQVVPYQPASQSHEKPTPGAGTSPHVPWPLQVWPTQPSVSEQVTPSPE